MRRRRYKNCFRRIEKGTIGLILFIVGLSIIAFTILPYTAWLVLLGCAMILLGYKLFI